MNAASPPIRIASQSLAASLVVAAHDTALRLAMFANALAEPESAPPSFTTPEMAPL